MATNIPAKSKANGQQSVIEPAMLFKAAQVQGSRPNLEDMIRVDEIKIATGQTLVLAVVADGIGGSNAGEVAAAEAIKFVFSSLFKFKSSSIVFMVSIFSKKFSSNLVSLL